MAKPEGFNGFVMVGGKSSRMGQDKALLQLEGKPLVQRAAEVLRPFVDQVTLLGPVERYGDLGFPVIADKWPDCGPLAAICTGLLSSTAEWNIFLACDLPMVSSQFIQLLVHRVRVTRADAIVPRTADGWQPLSAAYHSRCRTAFSRLLRDGERSIIRILEWVQVEPITQDEMVNAGMGENELANMNTPEDWAQITRLDKERR